MIRPPPSSTLFPYTTLFRSVDADARAAGHGQARRRPLLERAPLLGGEPSTQGIGERHARQVLAARNAIEPGRDRKSTRLNSSHGYISYAVFCLKKKTATQQLLVQRRFQLGLLLGFEATVLCLASLAIYRVVALSVCRRRPYLGIRLAQHATTDA